MRNSWPVKHGQGRTRSACIPLPIDNLTGEFTLKGRWYLLNVALPFQEWVVGGGKSTFFFFTFSLRNPPPLHPLEAKLDNPTALSVLIFKLSLLYEICHLYLPVYIFHSRIAWAPHIWIMDFWCSNLVCSLLLVLAEHTFNVWVTLNLMLWLICIICSRICTCWQNKKSGYCSKGDSLPFLLVIS